MGYQFCSHSGTTRSAPFRADLLVLLLLFAAYAAIASTDDRVDRGKTLAMDRGKGNCLACHMIEDGLLPGDLGPPLLAMKIRFPDRDLLKVQICDASVRNVNSRMPPFCRHGILTEDEVELIMDYLYTL
jgi:sulfur-oxidizing protein SoxX